MGGTAELRLALCDPILEDEFFRCNDSGLDNESDAFRLPLDRNALRPEYAVLAIEGAVPADVADLIDTTSLSAMTIRLCDRPSGLSVDSKSVWLFLPVSPDDCRGARPWRRRTLASVVTSRPLNASIRLFASASTDNIS
jgi:hypothetical protein